MGTAVGSSCTSVIILISFHIVYSKHCHPLSYIEKKNKQIENNIGKKGKIEKTYNIQCACLQSQLVINDFDHIQSFYKIAILNVSCTLFKKKRNVYLLLLVILHEP